MFLSLDILAVLPTGYGESLIVCLLLALLFAKTKGVPKTAEKITSIIVVVSPLNLL